MQRKIAFYLLYLFLINGLTIVAQPVLFETPLSPRIANYDINVTLTPEKRLLEGKEVLYWRNDSKTAVTELQFHLYLNAFRNSQSTFMIEGGGSPRGHTLTDESWGYIDVNRLVLLPKIVRSDARKLIQTDAEAKKDIPGRELTANMQFIQPDTPEHTDDKSVFSVQLPEPLLPGASLALFIEFTAKMPQPIARTGALEEFFFVAQWFPKIGVLQEEGWNCHQFHYNSEFFADFGVYNVWITLPEEYIVGATGQEVLAEHNGDGTVTHYYHAEDVHDFAWTASPEYMEFKGKSQDVDIRVLMQPDHEAQGPRYVEAAKLAVEYLQNWYGDYPYPNLTVVDPRRGARASGGTEYPTLFTASTRYGLPDGVHLVEVVIFHEFAHNYWYHLVATNEFEESWMDEGMTTYTEFRMLEERYGTSGNGIDFLGFKVNSMDLRRLEYLGNPDVDPMLKNAWEFYSSGSYVVNSYSKPGLLLTSLHNYLGEETMRKIMRTYLARWRFKHPKSQDFVAIVNEVSGKDLSSFFDQAFYTRGVLDYSVRTAFSRPFKSAAGFDYDLSDTGADSSMIADETPAETAAAIDSLTADSTAAGEAQQRYYSGVNIRRLGEFKFPVEIDVVFDDGEVVRENWDGQADWKKLRYLKPARLVSAIVDPENKLVMDINITNNSYMVEPETLGVNKLAIRWLFWMQYLLDQPEILNLLTFF